MRPGPVGAQLCFQKHWLVVALVTMKPVFCPMHMPADVSPPIYRRETRTNEEINGLTVPSPSPPFSPSFPS